MKFNEAKQCFDDVSLCLENQDLGKVNGLTITGILSSTNYFKIT